MHGLLEGGTGSVSGGAAAVPDRLLILLPAAAAAALLQCLELFRRMSGLLLWKKLVLLLSQNEFADGENGELLLVDAPINAAL